MFRNESGFYHSFVSLELSPAGISNASVTPLSRVKGVFAADPLPLGNGVAALNIPPVGRKFTQELLPPKARGRDLS